MFLLFTILLIVVAVYFYPNRNKNPLEIYKQKAKKYSGLSPEKYSEFINNLELSEQMIYSVTQSSKYLYKSIDALQDIPLYSIGGSSELIQEIHELASSIGNTMERLIAETAISQGVRFYPKYIKDLQDPEIEVEKVAIPTSGPWYQNADSGFWTHNSDSGWVSIEGGNPILTDETSASMAPTDESGKYQVYTVSTGPWSSQHDQVLKPISNAKWKQFIPKPFIDTMHTISRVMLPKSA